MAGIHGENLFVVSPAGQDVILSCSRDPYGLCGGTWHFNDDYTVDVLVGSGETTPNFMKERAERLRALSNHSLLITDVTTEDAGLYTCHKPIKDTLRGNVSCRADEDIRVNFSVLHGKFSQELRDNMSTYQLKLHKHDNTTNTLLQRTQSSVPVVMVRSCSLQYSEGCFVCLIVKLYLMQSDPPKPHIFGTRR